MGRLVSSVFERRTLAPRHGLLVVLAVTTGMIHVYLGITTETIQFTVLGGIFLAGLVVFFTRWFKPVLYLVGALYVLVLVGVWILTGMPLSPLSIADKIVQLVLFVLFGYLFRTEVRLTST